ncbi:MAG: ketoacyl-ACP synthase III [Rhodospirillales bacterium]
MKIVATRTAFPKTLLSNESLAVTCPDWDVARLVARTGVHARYVADATETALDLAEAAANGLADEYDIELSGIDALIVCTETPDYVVPGNASILQHRLGIRNDAFCLDINMGCSAFPYLLQIARGLMQGDVAKTVLILTADTYTRYIHPQDRSTRALFGDGAAATLLEHDPDREQYIPVFGSRGDLFARFSVKRGGARHPGSVETDGVREAENCIHMDGLKILSFFSDTVPKAVRDTLSKNKLAPADIDAFIFHQASAVALDTIQRLLEIPDAKMIRAFSHVGNLVSASVPAALDSALRDGRIRSGDLVVLCGFGVGLSWGVSVMRL